jgi:hypothetical protein
MISFIKAKTERKGTLPAASGTPPRRGIYLYSPIEGGFKGGVPLNLFLSV